MIAPTLATRVGDLRQLASVRRIVLDDGAEAGVRALAFSTGGGLDFVALSDRSLDIGTVHWRGVPLAWQSPVGFRSAALIDAEGDGGRGFGRGFSGFLVTCGLDHVRQPKAGHPLHGRLPYTPARLTAYGEDWEAEEPLLYCEGEMVQARFGGEALRLRRRIEAPIGGGLIRIRDEVQNLGPADQAQAMLYHFNLGYPAIADGTIVAMAGATLAGPLGFADAGPAVPRCFSAGAGPEAVCTVLTPTAAGGKSFEMRFGFGTDSLPQLQVWSDMRPRSGVLAIEPCTSPRLADGTSGAEFSLAPGERRRYSLTVSLRGTPDEIDWRSSRKG